MRLAQSDFERQCEVTRLLMQGLGSAQVSTLELALMLQHC